MNVKIEPVEVDIFNVEIDGEVAKNLDINRALNLIAKKCIDENISITVYNTNTCLLIEMSYKGFKKEIRLEDNVYNLTNKNKLEEAFGKI